MNERSIRGTVIPLPGLPHAHRPEVKAFAQQRDVIWAGSRLGLYRITPRQAQFLGDWTDCEIVALGPDGADHLLVVFKVRGKHHIARCNQAGRRIEEWTPPDDEPTCIFGHETVWIGGKQNIYCLEGTAWRASLPADLAGSADWIHGCGGWVIAALHKSGREKRPCLLALAGDGRQWLPVWQGTPGDRIRASDGRRICCKWTGDQRQPTLQSKPVLAAAFFEDGGDGWVQESTIRLRDQDGREYFRLQHDRFSRGHWLARMNGCLLVAGEQGVHAVDLDTGSLQCLTERIAGPRYAARIKHIWHLDEDRFLVGATHGAFVTSDGGQNWRTVEGAFDVHHVRRLFCGQSGEYWLATRDGIFVSRNGGTSWQTVPWNGNGLEYDKLSGVAASGDQVVWGGKGGLFVQKMPNEPPWRVAAIGARRIEDIVAGPDRRLLILCHDGALFALNVEQNAVEQLAQFPKKDGRKIVCREGRIYIFGRESIQIDCAGEIMEMALPESDRHYSFAVGKTHMVAFDENQAWRARIEEGDWRPIAAWPHGMDKPAGALTANGHYLLFTDGRRLWRLDFNGD